MQSPEEPTEGGSFVDYQPSFPDALRVPRYALYLVMAAIIVVVAAYAIVGHLIDDLAHDFADWAFGLKLEEKNFLDENSEECGLGTLENAPDWQGGRLSPAAGCPAWHGPQLLPGMEVCTAPPGATQHLSDFIQDSVDERSNLGPTG